MTGKMTTQQRDKKDVRPLLLMYAEAIEKTQQDIAAARKDLKRDYKANNDIEGSDSEQETYENGPNISTQIYKSPN